MEYKFFEFNSGGFGIRRSESGFVNQSFFCFYLTSDGWFGEPQIGRKKKIVFKTESEAKKG